MKRTENWCQQTLGYQFSDDNLLGQALTHRSAAALNNERLEFLGDAVLGLVIAGAVYERRPDADEGALSRMRSDLVRGETLADVARGIDVGSQLMMGSGEHRTGGHRRMSVLANALEALFGAVLLDGGYAAASNVILRLFASRLASLPDDDELKDPKTRLQELLQAQHISPPDYTLAGATGQAHAQTFEAQCRIDELDVTTLGTGTSRRRAEQAAATAALSRLLTSDAVGEVQ